MALVLSFLWPVVQTGINNFGIWIANSKETAPILAPFAFGTLERLLLPFGLHHMLTIPINYTQLGGTYEVLTGAAKGTQVFGQDPLWLAWITDLGNTKFLTLLLTNTCWILSTCSFQSGTNDRFIRYLDGGCPCHLP